MLYINEKQIDAINHLNKPIQAVYHMDTLVWQSVKSCYGRGYWINSAPWVNDEAWKNG